MRAPRPDGRVPVTLHLEPDLGAFAEEFAAVGYIYPAGTFVHLDRGQLTAGDFARARRWYRTRRAWSWLRYGWRWW